MEINQEKHQKLHYFVFVLLAVYYHQCLGEPIITTSTDNPQPIVAASEATLLTTPQLQFDQASVAVIHDSEYNEANDLIPDNSDINDVVPPLAGIKVNKLKLTKNRYKIIAISTNCTRDLFEIRLELNRAFHGLMYAKDFAHECRARGKTENNITLRLPTSGCGVRVEPRQDGTMELSVRVMLQIEEKLRQSSDILRTIRCKLPLNAMGLTLITPRESHGYTGFRNGRMQTKTHNITGDGNLRQATRTTTSSDVKPQLNEFDTTIQNMTVTKSQTQQQQQQRQQHRHSNGYHYHRSSSTTPRVRIWLELGGPDGSGSVVVGQATTLTVRAIVPGSMGVRIVDCAALDGLGESTQQLLDERGCPIDEQVMPALHTHFKPAEEGWSKQDEDDLQEKTFTATFPAFKFPDRERLHVSCGVQLCKGHCPNVNCRTEEKLILSIDKHLARIDVFNSLAVTAPQIEVDRLRYDRWHNMSVEEYPPYVRPIVNDGTLCLSVSKLALSFCILGLIFLIAIIVAICSLIRSRRRFVHYRGAIPPHSGRLQHAELCTSMFSSSSDSAQSARFGSKLFIPYYPNALPYGRVY
uniref:ZP domain-containing protein n=1 Tax=Glossina palpalis gambiensis TaxID=67801 RepID=A0A1B0AXZ0_9MUSC